MRRVIENDFLKVEIDDHGAEVRSVVLKETGEEYMWCGDGAYWGRVSPVLFPIVGGVCNKTYRYQGQEYHMGQHGFARDTDFSVESEAKDDITYVLRDTPESKVNYPFAFELRIRYYFTGNTLHVVWMVKNPASEMLYFSIGAHPAFACGNPEDGPKDVNLRFTKKGAPCDHMNYRGLNKDGNALYEDRTLPLTEGEMVVSEGFFDRSALMFEGEQADLVELTDSASGHKVTVTTDVPLFAIWSPEGKKAPFICIEPWYGRCDAIGFDDDFSERDHIRELAAGQNFTGGYEMKFEKV